VFSSPHDELKTISVSDLEDTIAKAVADKIGAKISCNISEIDFSSVHRVYAKISFSTPSMFLEEKGDRD
jgi:hypothetical protein